MASYCKFRECRAPDEDGYRSIQCKKCRRWIGRIKSDIRKTYANCPAPEQVCRPWMCGQWSPSDLLADIRWQFKQLRGFGDAIAWVLRVLRFRKKKGCGCPKRQEALNRWSYECTNAVAQTWRIVVGVPHDLLTKLLLRIAGLIVKVGSKLLPLRR